MQIRLTDRFSISNPAFVVVLITAVGFLFSSGTIASGNIRELKLRHGLPNFFNRIDTKNELVVPRFDPPFFYRSHYFLLDEFKQGEHTVTFSLSPPKLDKATMLAKLEIEIDNKQNYDEQEVVLENILLLGELIDSGGELPKETN